MIGTLLAVAGVATLVSGTAGAGWASGRRRGARDVETETAGKVTAMSAQRDAAERRAREAQAESARWRAMSLAGGALTSSAVFEHRPSPRDAEELARLVRGLTLVDDVVLADRSGNALSRETDAASADLAALAPHVLGLCRRMALGAIPVLDAAFETQAASHVHARPLSGRGEGTLLVVRTTSQKVNPLVVDAVVHAASRGQDDLPSGAPPPLAATGHTDRKEHDGAGPYAEVFDALARELGAHFTGIALVVDGHPVFSAAKDGPDATARASIATALNELAERSARVLRASGMARIELSLRGGQVAAWSALAPRSRFAVVTFGRADGRSSSRLDHLLGTVRRSLGRASGEQRIAGSAA